MGESGRGDALKVHSAHSKAETRLALHQAINRLREGRPQVVPPDAQINPSTVALEAGVDRTTLYRYHAPVLDTIRGLNELRPPHQTMRAASSERARLKGQTREYRELAEQAQHDKEVLKRINYRLDRRVHELESLLEQREALIAELRRQLHEFSNVVSLEKPGAEDGTLK